MNIVDISKNLLSMTVGRTFAEISKGVPIAFKSIAALANVLINNDVLTEDIKDSMISGSMHIKEEPDVWMKNNPNEMFDMVLYEYKRDTEDEVWNGLNAALEHVKDDGYLVFRNALPNAEYQQLDRKAFLKMNDRPDNAWVGKVWRAVVRLRSERRDLDIFVVNCNWGVAVVQKCEPKEKFTLSALPDYSVFEKNEGYYLNLKEVEWYAYYCIDKWGIKAPYMYVTDPLYMLQRIISGWSHLCNDPCSAEIENGFVLPYRKVIDVKAFDYLQEGGVSDCNNKFFTGLMSNVQFSNSNMSCIRTYEFDKENIKTSNESVVWLGGEIGHFGRLLIDGLSRSWWLVQNCSYKDKIAISYKTFGVKSDTLREVFYSFFSLLGIERERVIFVEKPTQFKYIIIPEQSVYRLDGVTPFTDMIFKKIRDSITPGCHKKIYLTRTRFQKTADNTFNESYFEDFYTSKGYTVIAPETMTIEEQISIVAGADEIVCVDGTLCILSMFAKDNVDITILMRVREFYTPHYHLLSSKGALVTYVDVSKNFLPVEHSQGPFILGITKQWREYVNKKFDIEIDEKVDDEIDRFGVAFMKKWLNNNVKKNHYERCLVKKTTLDILETAAFYVCGKTINRKEFE
jgi:hypothetical protein